MIKQVIFSNNEGAGCVADDYNIFINSLQKESFLLAGTLVNPGDEYHFTGLLTRPLLYVGNIENKLFFYLGAEKGRYYFKEINLIDERLIYISYADDSGTSHSYKDGAWFRPGKKAKAAQIKHLTLCKQEA